MERIEEEEDLEKKELLVGASGESGHGDDDLKKDNNTHGNRNVIKASSSQNDEISFNYRLDGDADNALVANGPPYWSLENDIANKNDNDMMMDDDDDDDPIRALEQPLLGSNDAAEDSSSSMLPYPFTFFEPQQQQQQPHDSLSSHWNPSHEHRNRNNSERPWYRTMWRRPAHEWTWIQAWRMPPPPHEYTETTSSQYDENENDEPTCACLDSRNRRVALGWVVVVLMAIWITHVYDIHFFRHHSHNDNDDDDDDGATLTRGEWIQSCATQLSSATLSSSSSFSSSLPDGGRREDILDWFLVGPGREFEPIPRHMTTPNSKNAAACDSLTLDSPAVHFASLYALLVLQADLNISLWENTDSHHKKTHKESNVRMTQTSMIQNVHDVCTKWHRVKCSSKKHEITGLYLSEMEGLAGRIPRELYGLQALERLELYGNPHLVGPIPWDVLGQLTELQQIYLHRTSLTGTLHQNDNSDVLLQSLQSLTNLEQVFLEHTLLEGTMPNALCQLRHRSNNNNTHGGGGGGGSLVDLHADCGGVTPRIHCDHPTCCTICDHHHDNENEHESH
uniref:Uncharacterized protein n=1 Tax=Attheya septentrionalis TaxID=420275 RepID=A0A7S2UNV5_9STRA|mmetsp:Transcript_6271/g.11147  ORF Transcript_6271/g.11147 Transcript_6271/m.11147 type:complete len:564 (+) Transcript_6271:200-1891(+)|eukprot:CAMPEP_0198288520 /NCGR_PEP_ID=MMETSP1449-20131203/6987_1 /TAXON_ID=420275 /ORGANISM="Attheya septentrionalis, Strain CCMP2084" /LENGTH=563 /DNA_ID=CAMNT_0043986675 /DNA_START=133 /DNA_END=1824 /DNA_ORIENTATION=-